MNQTDFLGEKSYPAIVQKITERIQAAKADTLAGDEMLSRLYDKLNEETNITPMMDVKEFITGAEKIAGDDAMLKEVVDFCKKEATGGDLNYVINLCKEEHFQTLKRAGHPDPQATIKTIEEQFNEPASIIEQGVKSGIFDRLASKLLNDVKLSLGVDVHQEAKDRADELNESYQYGMGGFCSYCPIGISYEDVENNRILSLCESDILSYDKKTENFTKLNESVDTINNKARRIMQALTESAYDPETEMFSLSEAWDFKLELHTDGKCFVGLNENMKEIDCENLKKMFKESMKLYESQQNPDFNRSEYTRDAENIICLMEHAEHLVKFDNLRVIRNLNEGLYVMYQTNIKINSTPEILSMNGAACNKFDSFLELCESVKAGINYDCTKLFEGEIFAENEQLAHRREKLASLMEQQSSLNEQITKVNNLKKLADVDSPAMDKLNEQARELDAKLRKNIEEVNFYENEFRLH